MADDDVDLWICPLPLTHHTESMALETLSEDEHERLARYAMPGPRSQFVASRGVLRQILQHYLGWPARSFRLALGPYGKPRLVEPHSLSFNVSHTDGLLLVAVATRLPVGVDVEKVRPIRGSAALAARYFSPAERSRLAVDPMQFLRLWTCRESAVKAAGIGISAGWERVRIVERGPDEADAFGLGQDCCIRMFSPRTGYVAALSALTASIRIHQLSAWPQPSLNHEGRLT